MFSSKTLKLFVFAFFIFVILSVFAVPGGASEAVAPKIIGKNILYTDKTAIQFAVSPIGVDKNDVSLIVTKADGTEKIISDYEESKVMINGVDGALVFTIEGVPASAVCDTVTAVVKSGNGESESITYSVAEYFFERLYSDGIINASYDNALAIRQKSLYLDYLSYAESSQELFKNYYGEQNVTLVSNYSYIGGNHAVFDNKNDSMLSVDSFETTVTADEELSSNRSFLNKWTVTSYGSETSTQIVADGERITVSGKMSVSAVCSDATGDYYLSDEDGRRIDYDSITEITEDSIAYSGSTGSFEIVDGSLHFEDGDAENFEMGAKYRLSYPASYNVTIFEFDFKLTEAMGNYPIQVKVANQAYTIYYTDSYNSSYGAGKKLCMKINGLYIPINASVGSWSNIRFEHYKDAKTLKVFVNNDFAFDISTVAGTQSAPAIYLTSNERNTASNSDLYIDNIYVGHLTKTFVPGDPKAN